MRKLSQQDLFEVLQIGFREDSYTELIANVFRNNSEAALGFLSKSFPQKPPTPAPIEVETRESARLKDGRRAIPDLVLYRGVNGDEIYWIEAKIKASEGRGQTKKYQDAGAQLVARHGGGQIRGEGFLTLDGTDPESDAIPLSYEDLIEFLKPESFAVDSPMRIAVETLSRRFTDYYQMKRDAHEALADEDRSLQEFLGRDRGLVTRTDLFHWLMEHAVKDPDLERKCEVTGRGNPLVRLSEGSWAGVEYELKGTLAPLRECFDVHLETQLFPREDPTHIALMLHFETNKYMTAKQLRSVPTVQEKEFEKRRDEFSKRLWQRPLLAETGFWKKTSKHAQLQLANCDAFSVEGATIGEFNEWLRERVPVMKEAVRQTLAEVC